MTIPNLLHDLPLQLEDEAIEVLAQKEDVRIERIVSRGHTSPPGFWYDQEQAEFVTLLQGAARLLFEDEVLELQPGDWVNIPPHRKHRVEWTDPDQTTIWLAMFYG